MAVHKLARYVKPYELIFDSRYGVWARSVTILGNVYSFADRDPQRVCAMIDRHIFMHMRAHNCGECTDEAFIEFHARDILPMTTLFLERLRRA